jgi:hypothetical protein
MSQPSESHELDRLALDIHLRRLVDRRRALQLIGGAGLVAVVGCSSDDDDAAGAFLRQHILALSKLN